MLSYQHCRASGHEQRQFLLQLDIQQPKHVRRTTHEAKPYLFPGGTSKDCHFATFFSLLGDQLRADGQLVTASAGAGEKPFTGGAGDGPISHGFSLENDILQWKDKSFSGGKASFCLSESNVVVVVFDEARRPAGCTLVNLVKVPCKLTSGHVSTI